MDYYGPALPPSRKKARETERTYGPTLPHRSQLTEQSAMVQENKSEVPDEIDLYGPPLPPHLMKRSAEKVEEKKNVSDSDSDDEVYGPLPPSSSSAYNEAEEFEKRAKMMKDKLTGKHDAKPARESWMLELPEAKAKQFGLGPRSFSTKQASDAVVDESWTETPGKSKSGVREEISSELIEKRLASERDEKMEKIVLEHDSDRRKDSLLKEHQKKLKRKLKEENSEGKKERKPFNRDADLAISSIDASKRRAIIKKAQLLDSRFSAGAQKFL